MQLIDKPENVILVVRWKCLLLLHILLSCPVLWAEAQDRELLFRSFGVNEGLSHSSVYSIYQDSKGFMWFGTADGLNRYDGREIRVYRPAEALQNQEAAYIRNRIVEDRNGNIWYLGFAGLFCWDRVTEQITKKADVYGSTAVYFLDSKDVLWYHDMLNGIHSYDLRSGKTNLYAYPFRYDHNKFWNFRLTTDDKRYLWFSVYENGELYRFDIQAGKYERTDHGDGITLLDHENGKLWVSDDKRVSVYEAATMRLKSSVPYKGPSLRRAEVLRDKGNQLWLSVNGGGLKQMDEVGNVVNSYHHNDHGSFSIASDNVTTITEDRTGGLWLGTDGGGVSRASLKERPFGSFPADEKDLSSVRDLLVWAIFEPEAGKVMFSTDKGGLNILDRVKNEVREVTVPRVKGQIRCIARAGDDTWVGYLGGITRIKDGNGPTIALSVAPGVALSEGAPNVLKIVPVGEDKLLIGTTQGLRIVERQQNVWKEVPLEMPKYFYGKLNDIVAASDGKYWLSYQGYGLLLAGIQGRKVMMQDSLLSRESLRTIHQDEIDKDVLWVTSKTGLWKVNISTRVKKLYNTKDGLPNANVYGVLEDRDHDLWISSNGGLSCYNRRSGLFSNYTHSDGLQSNEFNSGAFHKGRSGKLYFGGVKGFNWVTEKSVRPDTVRPGLLLTKMALADSSISPFALRNNLLELSYRRNYFDLQVLVADYTRPEANIVKYRLIGWDKDWQHSTTGEIHYANLIPGDYELEIRGVGSNRVESEPYLLSVSVVAPFWQQVWFRISLFVLLAGTVIAFIYFNYRRKIGKALQELEQQKLLAAERNRISRDLHDDIGSAITKITLISELIPLQQKSNDLVLEDVKNISATARTVSQNMSDIVWALHAQHDSLEGLLSYMREQVREFLDPLGMKYWLAFPEEVPELKLNGEQRRNILLVTKEALNNAVKYSGAKLIIVACRPGSGMIEFSVTDDGKGFDLKQAREHGNGLKNMSRRMESIGGDLEILSSAGGTTIVYRLKI